MRDATGDVAELFKVLGVKSVLIMPIVIAGRGWGCVGVDSCTTERNWSSDEVRLLEIVANLIGTMILRDRHVWLLAQVERRFHAVAEAAQDAIVVVDANGAVEYWNPAAQRIFGYTEAEAFGRPIHELIAPPEILKAAAFGLRTFEARGAGCLVGRTRELTGVHKNGMEIPVELSLSPMNVNGVWSAVGILRDIRVRKETEQQVAWLARHDGLTGLPNRRVFVEELREAISNCRRGGQRLAVFNVDLDRF
jgi:PAS domain S-box-containing protein